MKGHKATVYYHYKNNNAYDRLETGENPYRIKKRSHSGRFVSELGISPCLPSGERFHHEHLVPVYGGQQCEASDIVRGSTIWIC